MLFQFLLENETVEKSRKSLLGASVVLLIFAAVNFLSNEMSFFGVKVLVSQDKIVTLGRLGVGFLLIMFLLRLAPPVLDWIVSKNKIDHQLWEKAALASFPEEPNPGEEYYPDPEPWEESFYKDRIKREKRLVDLERGRDFTATGIGIALNYLIPVLFSLLAIAKPYVLSQLLEVLTS